MCSDIDISDLHTSFDQFEVGCVSDASTHPDIPECDLTNSGDTDQAGYKTLGNGMVGKLTNAFDELNSIPKQFHQLEYKFYMQLWCLKKLRDHGHMSSSHVLDPFVLGSDPWAPEFFGICRSPDATELYMVMDSSVLLGKRPDATHIRDLLGM